MKNLTDIGILRFELVAFETNFDVYLSVTLFDLFHHRLVF